MSVGSWLGVKVGGGVSVGSWLGVKVGGGPSTVTPAEAILMPLGTCML